MVMIWIVLATEDELSEQVGLCLAAEAGLEVGQCLRRGGNGYLRSRVTNFCQIAEQQPVFLITDLDQSNCASALMKNWFGQIQRPAKFIFRVAVREIESWLLADHEAMFTLLGSRTPKLPSNPDNLPDPKQVLLHFAERAPRGIREELVTRQKNLVSQGLGYNALLCSLVRDNWLPERAATRSPSLQRARVRLRELAEKSI
jgi:hypothetical protein